MATSPSKKLLVLAAPGDRSSVIGSLSVLIVRTIANPAYRAFVNIGEIFDREAQGLEWTIFRVGWLGDGKEGQVVETMLGSEGAGRTIQRADIAKWLIEQVESSTARLVGQKPYICSQR